MEAYRQRGNKKCVVPNCNDTISKRHRFPKNDIPLLDKWINGVQNPILKTKTYEQIFKSYVVCDLHFSESDRVPGTKRGLIKGSFPTQLLPPQSEQDSAADPLADVNPRSPLLKAIKSEMSNLLASSEANSETECSLKSSPIRKFEWKYTVPQSEDDLQEMPSSPKNKRKKIDDSPENGQNLEKDLTIKDVMLKLMEMENRYISLLEKYEQQAKENNELRCEVLSLQKKLNYKIEQQ